MNILISVNEKYVPHVKVMLASLRDNMKDERIDVYLIYKSLSEVSVQNLSEYLANRYNIELFPIKLENTIFDDCNVGMHFSEEIFFRLLAPQLVPKSVEKILWLDADIVITDSLKSFYDTDISEYYVCGCEGHGDTSEYKKRLGIDLSKVYFNSGVLMMNLKKMREDNSIDDIVRIFSEYGDKLVYKDQDVLNIAFAGEKTLYVDPNVYNLQVGSNFALPQKEYQELIKKNCILHFASSHKPWNIIYKNGIQKYYWKYAIKDGRIGEYIKYCLTAPIKTVWLLFRLKQKGII